jgi:hypothetical protein
MVNNPKEGKRGPGGISLPLAGIIGTDCLVPIGQILIINEFF